MVTREQVVLLLGAIGNPDVDSDQVMRALGQMCFELEDVTSRLGDAVASLAARVERIEVAARRPLLAVDDAPEGS